MVMQRSQIDNPIPPQGLLDYLSRRDELLIEVLRKLDQLLIQPKIAEGLYGAPTPTLVQPVVARMPVSGERYYMPNPEKIFDDHGCREASTTYYPEYLANGMQVVNILIIVKSSLDQDVTVQAIGAITEIGDGTNTNNIESSKTLSAGTVIGIGIDLNSLWYPFMGIAVTTGAAAPTSGNLNAWVYRRIER